MEQDFQFLKKLTTDYHAYANDDKRLLEALSNLPKELVSRIYEQYSYAENKFQPVNLLRAEVARRLQAGEVITPELVEEIKSRIREKDTTYFRGYSDKMLKNLKEHPIPVKHDIFIIWQTFWRIFHVFFFREDVRNKTKTALRGLAEQLITDIDLQDFTFHGVDFYGPNNFGIDYCWIAFYPKSRKSHQQAAQLMLEIRDTPMAGYHQGSEVGNEKELKAVNTYEEIKTAFQQYKDEVIQLNEELNSSVPVEDTLTSGHATPRYWVISAGEGANRWEEFYQNNVVAINFSSALGDLRLYENIEAIGEKLKALKASETNPINDRLACWQFVHDMNEGDIIMVKRGRTMFLGWGIVTSPYRYNAEKTDYQHERSVRWKNKGEWKLDYNITAKTLTDFSEYSEDISIISQLLGIPDSIEDAVLQPTKNYWWLNANPKIWRIDETQLHKTIAYTSYNERGHKRQKYRYFQMVQPGDIVVAYETTPNKQVKALFDVKEGLHLDDKGSEVILFKKIENLAEPIDYETLKSNPELQQCEPLSNNQGSLFRLLPEEFEVIRQIIDEKAAVEKTPITPYTKADALKELFLSEQDFDQIIELLKYKKNVVLQGPPGVGKTFAAKRIAKAMITKDNDRNILFCQFHQSYSYEDFIMGIRPDTEGKFRRRKGIFHTFCERAQRDPENAYFVIIDEINRGNLSKIFGELLMLIESDKRSANHAIQLTYSEPEESFFIPENLYIIGTMNTADRSLAMVDYALRRRFAFVNMAPEFGEKFKNYLKAKIPIDFIDEIVNKVEALNDDIANDKNLGKGFCIGHSYFTTLPEKDAGSEKWYKAIVKYEIAPQLREYWFDDESTAGKAIQSLKLSDL